MTWTIGVPLFEMVEPVITVGEERKVDFRLVLVGIDHPCGHVEDRIGPVERGDKQAAPAGRRADGPEMWNLAGAAGSLGWPLTCAGA